MARPSKLTPEVVGKLEYAFSIGASIEEACFYADIHKDTYYDWVKKNEGLSDRFDQLRQRPVFLARETVVKGVQQDPRLAMDYLSRKAKDEFSPRTEQNIHVKEMPTPILGGLTQRADDEVRRDDSST